MTKNSGRIGNIVLQFLLVIKAEEISQCDFILKGNEGGFFKKNFFFTFKLFQNSTSERISVNFCDEQYDINYLFLKISQNNENFVFTRSPFVY